MTCARDLVAAAFSGQYQVLQDQSPGHDSAKIGIRNGKIVNRETKNGALDKRNPARREITSTRYIIPRQE
jgi:hypothetical protein